jgi:hypothetical protein
MTTETGLTWTPPHGMTTRVVAEWRAFYGKARTEYGITPQDYRDLYRAQHGVCYICRVAKGKNPDDPHGRGGRRLGVDHNHALGNRREAVRGLLCTGSLSANTCNRLIARYSLAQLRRAVAYLEAPPAQLVFDATAGLDWWERQQGRSFPGRDGHLAVVLDLKTVDRGGH